MSTLFASFRDADAAERAAGALLDNGADRADMSIIANDASGLASRVRGYDAAQAEASAKEGFSTTTPADVAVGAVKGAAAGAGIGLAAALAALFIPGIGLVLGGGALATALAAAAGSAAAGTAAGGVIGYLKDQGVSEEYVTRYSDALQSGGAVLALNVPTGSLTSAEAEGILAKYGAINVGTFYGQQQVVAPAIDTTRMTPDAIPANVVRDTPVVPVQPLAAPVAPVSQGTPVVPVTPVTPSIPVEVETGQPMVVAQSPVTNDPLAPSTTVVVDPNTGLRRAVTMDPVTGLQTSAVVDPVTGEAIPSTVVTAQTEGVNTVSGQSVVGAVPGTPVVATPPLAGPTVVNTPVVQQGTVVDEYGRVIQTTEVVEQDVVVDPNRAKLI